MGCGIFKGVGCVLGILFFFEILGLFQLMDGVWKLFNGALLMAAHGNLLCT